MLLYNSQFCLTWENIIWTLLVTSLTHFVGGCLRSKKYEQCPYRMNNNIYYFSIYDPFILILRLQKYDHCTSNPKNRTCTYCKRLSELNVIIIKTSTSHIWYCYKQHRQYVYILTSIGKRSRIIIANLYGKYPQFMFPLKTIISQCTRMKYTHTYKSFGLGVNFMHSLFWNVASIQLRAGGCNKRHWQIHLGDSATA